MLAATPAVAHADPVSLIAVAATFLSSSAAGYLIPTAVAAWISVASEAYGTVEARDAAEEAAAPGDAG
jgi:hypothetical protein